MLEVLIHFFLLNVEFSFKDNTFYPFKKIGYNKISSGKNIEISIGEQLKISFIPNSAQSLPELHT